MDKENSLMEATMAIKMDPSDLLSFRELLIANSIQLDIPSTGTHPNLN
jgi:hypothetical protein